SDLAIGYPVVLKPNIGGSGAGIERFSSPDQLRAAVEANRLYFVIDSTALVQEAFAARGGMITRVEVLGGKYLYAIQIHTTGESFNLCPADICQNTRGEELTRIACPVDAPKNGMKVEGYEPPREVIEDVERIVELAGVEVGGIEYVVDERTDRQLYYDVNALSNCVADPGRVIGFDITLIAELNLNDIKGAAADSLDAWSTAAALAAVTERIELMVAVQPTFHLPALLAKQAANIDHISNGRLTLNVVSSWWSDE